MLSQLIPAIFFVFSSLASIHCSNASQSKECQVVQQKYFVHQKMDHFNGNDSRTWQQLFLENGVYFDANRPSPIVFLVVGREQEVVKNLEDLCDRNRTVVRLAHKRGALLLQLEHRFFENETRTSALGKLNASNRHLLSAEQALADLATFINGFSTERNLSGARWVAFGCSYAGALAAWLRQKYPHLVAGSVACSAPITPKMDFWEYEALMEKAIRSRSEQCALRLHDSMRELAAKMQHEKANKELRKIFGRNETELRKVPRQIYDTWADIVQYNAQVNGTYQKIDEACQRFTGLENGSKATLEQFAAAFSHYFRGDGDESREAVNPWWWMVCNQFGWFQNSGNETSMFGPVEPLGYFVDELCAKPFGVDAQYVKRQIEIARSDFGDACSFKATNVVFINGDMDQWSAVSMGESGAECRNATADAPNHIVSLMNPGGSHCSEWTRSEFEPLQWEQNRQRIFTEVDHFLASALERR